MNRLTFTAAAVSLLCLAPLSAAYSQEPQVHGRLYNTYSQAVAQANPWDKYQAEPTSKTKSSAPSVTPQASTPTASDSGAAPWDKYPAEPSTTPKASPKASNSAPSPQVIPIPATAEGSPEVEENLPEVTGDNPWDKYAPAPSPVKVKKKNTAKIKDRPTKLELAQPLPEMEVPQGARVIKNNLAVGTDNYFAIEYAGQLVGYSQYKINRLLTLGGQSTYVMDSASRIKMGVDSVQDLKFTANTQIDKKTLAPALFLCIQGEHKSKDALSVNCIYSEDFIAQNNNYMGKEQGYLQKYSTDQPPLLVFNNLWGHLDTFPEHYWLMVRAASQGGVLETYDPILQGIGKTIVYKPIKESWKDRNGAAHTTFVYKITDANSAPLAYVRLYAKNYELAEIKEIGSGLVFRRSTPGVVSAVAKSSGQRIKANSEISNIYFQDPNKLTYLEAFVDLRLRGGELAQHQIKNYKQQFYGEVKEGQIKGRAVVSSDLKGETPKAKFPFTEKVPEELEKYLQACPGVELEVNSLTTKAKEVTWKSETAFQAAQRLNGYVSNQIAEGVALPSARQTLENQVGNPEGKALLLTALLRAVKIPARVVGGLSYNKGSFTVHRWTEAWLGAEDGWVAFDPSTNESGFINASHITLWESGDLQAMDIYVEKFSPRPPRTTDYFKTALKWPIGEKRTYGIYHKGKLIGLESSYMYDMEVGEGGETYDFKSESVILRDETPLVFESTLSMNQNGLPISFQTTEDNGQKVHRESFTFRGNNINQALDLKESKSLPKPAKSKALIEREKAEAEKQSEIQAEETQLEKNPPLPESVQVEPTNTTAQGASLDTPPQAQSQPPQTEPSLEKAANANKDIEKPEASSTEAAQADKLGQGIGEAAQGASGDVNKADDLPEEAISNAEQEAAEAEAKKQAELKLREETKERLLEIKACYDEAKEQAAEAEKAKSAETKLVEKEDITGESAQPEEVAEPKTRQIPYSIGTYLVDPRFLSQWALVVEQSPVVTPEKATQEAQPDPELPKVDPNTGVIASSEVIAPNSTSTSEVKSDDSASNSPAGETGAGTFNPNSASENEEDEAYSFKAFIPGSLKVQDLAIQRADADETITMPDGKEVETARLDTEKGMLFYMDLKTGKVLKISIPSQDLEMYLEDTRFEL